MIHCPNCQTLNSIANQFCQNCRTPIPKRYLWVVGRLPSTVGSLLADRYQVVSEQTVLDIKPGLKAKIPTDIPSLYLPYMRLSPYQLHVPQLYAILSAQETGLNDRLLLLEKAAIARPLASQTAQIPHILPALERLWPTVPALRQLSWLRQIAELWLPCQQESVAATLLDPVLLRVDGSTVRLLQLHLPSSEQSKLPITLSRLGRQWQTWSAAAQPEIRDFCQTLSQRIIQGELTNSEAITQVIDQQLRQQGESQTRRIYIATQTDQGPTRQRNEDACFPDSNGGVQTWQLTPTPAAANQAQPLLIVCDGIGGHEGGNVASNLAIATIHDHLQDLLRPAADANRLPEPATVSTELEVAICAANDQIANRNDQEQRQERQRMGTTLVMAFAQHHELYVANIGDSRAYWITRQGCRQITVDDDVATRDVRLGYLLHQEAVQQPGSGALVQALGMANSNYLHPSVLQLTLDEDGVFLLCSDGLSDNDLVEYFWQTELLPILDGRRELRAAAQQLINVANQCNGYDNVTVGLMHVQVHDPAWATIKTALNAEPAPDDAASVVAALYGGADGNARSQSTQPTTAPAEAVTADDTNIEDTDLVDSTQLVQPAGARSTPTAADSPTLKPPARSSRRSPLVLLLSVAAVLACGGLLLYLLVPTVNRRVNQIFAGSAPSEIPVTSTPDLDPPGIDDSAVATIDSLAAQDFLRVRQLTADGEVSQLRLRDRPALPSLPVDDEAEPDSGSAAPGSAASPSPSPGSTGSISQEQGILPVGSILKVESTQQTQLDQPRWIQVQVCSIPVPNPNTVTPSETGAPSVTPLDSAPDSASSPTVNSDLILQAGTVGWIAETELLPHVEPISVTDPDQQGACVAAS
ncbi:MAG: protein phosphatase 2C domain-containing protein [Thainema sp.]